ncbi:glycosyltransferase [Virgibacillus alimentarius]|uniref:glycosyltransferase n=1 Tax=Virgibacillus alimentarius TaxID=698769 RepID=UPI0004936367|nr:glycosyltransferase [Virgibacillus alimentarius]
MKRKKVLFFIYQMGAGGAARTLLNIINNLDRSKFEPVLVTLDYNSDYEANVKSDVTFIKINEKRLRNAIFPLAKLIRELKVDLVFSTIPNYNTIAILANLLSFTRAKNIVREADNLSGGFLTDLKLRGYGMMYKWASQVVSLSEGVKQNLIQRYKVKSENIKVIYNPVDLKNIRKHMNEGVLAEEHLPIFHGEEKVIITAGRLVKQKDHQTLIDAFAKVHKQINSKLVILGEGPLKDTLIKQTERLGIQDKVHFIGFQNNPYVYFKHADLFVLTSIHEGFGHVLAEALATGTPVVSTDCASGPAEVLDDGKYGLLAPVGDVNAIANNMQEVLTYDKEKLDRVKEAGYKRVEDFDARQIADEYGALFTETMAR